MKVCSDISKKHTAFIFRIAECGKGDRACAKPVGDEKTTRTPLAQPTVGDVRADRCEGQTLFT